MSMNSLPQWTAELTDTFVTGEDQLGVEGAAQGYQQWLIPGIITTTDRARYYSFYAWVLHRFINLPDSSRLLKDFRGSFYKRHEVALILGAFSHHKDREIIGGLVGSGINNFKVRRWWKADDPVSLDVDYFVNKLGGFGQYYLTAMQAMGIVGTNEHPTWVYPLTPRGEALAQAYQQSISQSTYAQKLAEQGQLTALSHADAQEFGALGCLCPEALAQGKDLPLLRHAFFRLDQHGADNPHVRRRLALAVVLDLVRGAGGQFRRELLRPALYLGEYAPGLAYQPSPALQEWALRWRLVEIRHLYTFGLQCLWAAFLLQLRQQPGGIALPEFMDRVKEKLDAVVFDLNLGEYLDQLCAGVSLPPNWETAHTGFDQACRQGSGLDEYTCYLKAARSPTDAENLLGFGVRILAQSFLRFQHWHLQNAPIWQEMATRERLSLASFYRFTQGFLSSPGGTLGAWLERLYREFILGQHEFIALEKLRYQGYDTFKFAYREGQFYWPFASPDAYQEPIRLAANRLFNALTILTDLGLVVKNDQGEFSLNADGESILAQSVEAIRHDS